MKNKFIIFFAGAPGSSKTPISNYLSCNLDLPILNNDSIRTEVKEDYGELDQKKYLQRRDTRIKTVLQKGKSFIYDASIDREWISYNQKIKGFNYNYFIISLDLSKKFLEFLYKIKKYDAGLKELNKYFNDHKKFLKQFKNEVNLHIADKKFPQRLELSYKKVKEWLKS